jgi:hypothetical protein
MPVANQSLSKAKTLAAVLSVSGALYLAATLTDQSSPHVSLFLGGNEEQEEMRAYINFMARYQKVYASKEQASQKYSVFKDQYKRVKAHNTIENVPFTLAIN